MGAADPAQSLFEGRRIGQVHHVRRQGRTREMQVRIGQSGDGDLIRLEGDPLREGVGPGLQEHL